MTNVLLPRTHRSHLHHHHLLLRSLRRRNRGRRYNSRFHSHEHSTH